MNRIFKLFAFGSLVAFVAARLRRRTGASAHTAAPELQGRVDAEAPAFRGISDVDPQPLTQFGEAVDPDALQAAHAEPALLRGQLPVHGKNIP
jgi:hypothetical protein